MDLNKILEDLDEQPVDVLYELKERVDAALQRIVHDEIKAAKQKLERLMALAGGAPKVKRTYTRKTTEDGVEKRGRGRPRKVPAVLPPEEAQVADTAVETTLNKLRAITSGGTSEEDNRDVWDDAETSEDTSAEVAEDVEEEAVSAEIPQFSNPIDDDLTPEELEMEEKIAKNVRKGRKNA